MIFFLARSPAVGYGGRDFQEVELFETMGERDQLTTVDGKRDACLTPFDRARPDTSALAPSLRVAVEAAFDFVGASHAPSTLLAYRKAWGRFAAWCAAEHLPALPSTSDVVVAYVGHLATRGRKVATVTVALAAIGAAHIAAGVDPPPTRSARVRACVAGMRRTLGVHPSKKAPLSVKDLRAMLAFLPGGVLGVRDRALLLLWWICASRRSELSGALGLRLESLDFAEDGLRVFLARSKTDQEGRGRTIAVPYSSRAELCPVRATQAWTRLLAEHGHVAGPLFRAVRGGWVLDAPLTAAAAVLRVKHYAALAGKDVSKISGHSMRAGFVTAAARAGRSDRSIMLQTGHRSVATLAGYVRDARVMEDTAAVGLLDEGVSR